MENPIFIVVLQESVSTLWISILTRNENICRIGEMHYFTLTKKDFRYFKRKNLGDLSHQGLQKIGRLILSLSRKPVISARILKKSLSIIPYESVDLRRNLDATYKWLFRAQDATPDNGVSAGLSLTEGWMHSYPETTGYIIPTFLALSKALNFDEPRNRA